VSCMMACSAELIVWSDYLLLQCIRCLQWAISVSVMTILLH
jgi:hypothetical protein